MMEGDIVFSGLDFGFPHAIAHFDYTFVDGDH